MERVFTNRAANVKGATTSVTVRLPNEIVSYIDAHLDGEISNRSEFLQHWAQIGVRVSMDTELSEALEWALGRDELPTLLDAPMEPEPVVTYGTGYVKENEGTVIVVGPVQNGNEVESIHESQLEALRNRVK